MDPQAELALVVQELTMIRTTLATMPVVNFSEGGRSVDFQGSRSSLIEREKWLIARIQQLQIFELVQVGNG